MDKITDTDREGLEDSIMDAHLAAEKYAESGREVHRKMLEISVKDVLEYFELFGDAIKQDPKVEAYKVHMLIPLQLYKLLEMEDDEKA